MNREEAIKVLNSRPYTGEVREALETLIPELRGNEDDRIIRAIIDALYSHTNSINLLSSRGYQMVDIEAWLEKQKEQFWVPTDEQRHALGMVIKYSDSNADSTKVLESLLDDLTKIANPKVANWKDKQKERKPASTEDMPYITDEHFYEREPADSFKYKLAEYMTKNCRKEEGPDRYTYAISSETILKMAEEELLKRGVVQKPAEWKQENIDKLSEFECAMLHIGESFFSKNASLDPNDTACVKKQAHLLLEVANSAEWSEEDEKMINTIVSVLGQYIDYKAVSGIGSGYATPRYSKEIAWLNSLRPQSKIHYWTEEEIEPIIGDYLTGKEHYGGMLARLRCLKPKPQWCPSEEQMKALNALNLYGDLSYAGQQNQLISLYQDLKKLM